MLHNRGFAQSEHVVAQDGEQELDGPLFSLPCFATALHDGMFSFPSRGIPSFIVLVVFCILFGDSMGFRFLFFILFLFCFSRILNVEKVSV
jgi:hypothetical protein